jgi:exonuclease III
MRRAAWTTLATLTFRVTRSTAYCFPLLTYWRPSSRMSDRDSDRIGRSAAGQESPPFSMSAQDLRTKRLLALGILQAQPLTREEVNSAIELSKNADANETSFKKPNIPPPQVIDLLSSDDSDSCGDLVELARKIENRSKTQNRPSSSLASQPTADARSRNPNNSTSKRAKAGRKDDADAALSSSTARKPLSGANSENTIVKNPSSQSVSLQRSSSSSSLVKFQVATWNVWFGPMGNGDPHAGPRMRALCRLLQQEHVADSSNPLWCIGLQEVIAETAQYLAPMLEKAGYTVFRQPQTAAPYGCALAVHSSTRLLEQGWCPYTTTCMSRGFLYARVAVPFSSDQILFTTTHLESWSGQGYTGAEQRPRQLREMQDFCTQQFQKHSNLRTAILTGDMNWDDERPRSSTGLDPVMSTVLSNGWKDSWLETKPTASATCYTYDGKMNPMLGGNLRRRFDRIVMHGNGTKAVSTKLLGTQALPDLVWSKYSDYTRTSKEMPTAPSDHFGYLASFQLA